MTGQRIKHKYYEPEEGEWVTPVRSPNRYRMACCDCALTHWMEFRVVKDRVQFRVFRNDRATAALRRAPQKCQSLEAWEIELRERGKKWQARLHSEKLTKV